MRLVLLATVLLATLADAATLYVAPDGSSTAPYDTWAKASTGLTLAATAANDGDTIYVTNGTYSRWTVPLRTNFYWTSMNGPAATIIDGGGVEGSIVSVLKATFSGFTFQNCTGTYSGIYIQGPSAVWSNCVFRAFKATDAAYVGAVAHVEAGCTGLFYNCTFFSNLDSGHGGALGIQAGARAYLTDCIFSNNSAGTGNGGALYVLGAVSVNRCTFLRNTAGIGQAIYFGSGAGLSAFSNCVFAYNSTLTGYGTVFCLGTKQNRSFYNCLFYGNQDIYYTLAGGQAFNCTLVGNANIGGYAAIDNADGGNNISWANYPDDITDGGQTNTCYGTKTGAITLSNCITNYPSFVDDYSAVSTAANSGTNFVLGASGLAGFAIQSGSPCIDTGSNFPWTVSAVDFATNSRIANAIVDIGAYEYTAAAATGDPSMNREAAWLYLRAFQ